MDALFVSRASFVHSRLANVHLVDAIVGRLRQLCRSYPSLRKRVAFVLAPASANRLGLEAV